MIRLWANLSKDFYRTSNIYLQIIPKSTTSFQCLVGCSTIVPILRMGTMVEQPTRHATHGLYTYYIYTVPSHRGRYCIADEIDWPMHTACVKMLCHNATAAKLFVKHALTCRLHTFSCQWALSRRHTKCCNILYMARFTAGWANSNYVYPNH